MPTPAKPVARVGDVTVTVSTATDYPKEAPTASGAWAQTGDVTATTVPAARSEDTEVLIGASCVFTFTGTDKSSGTPLAPPPTSTVTLSPGSTVLHVGGSAPLVDGDTNKDDYGNTLTVVSTAAWRTA